MRVTIAGKGQVELTKSDFVAAGGEGSVYVKGQRAFKIYQDPDKALPEGKLRELAAIQATCVIKPEELLTDGKRPVGYTMRFVSGGVALCQLFTKAFRERNGINHQAMLELVRSMRDGISQVHSAGVLIVDLNELNFLVSSAFDEVFFIDADSYQTRNYPAKALMESVRDWQAYPEGAAHGNFSEGSDWFSFAIVSYQLFRGVHPYKGKHPSIHGIAARMQQNISVYDPSVSLPPTCYPEAVIPEAYRAWYKSLFVDGKRLAPPAGMTLTAPPVIIHTSVISSGALGIDLVRAFDATILDCFSGSGLLAVRTADQVFVNNIETQQIEGKFAAGVTPHGHAVLAQFHRGRLTLMRGTTPVSLSVVALDVMGYDGRIYVRTRSSVVELQFRDGQQTLATQRQVAQAHEHAAALYPGVLVQTLLGACYATIFPRSGAAYALRIQELDGQRIVDAKYEGGVLMAIGEKSGTYSRFVIRFAEDPNTHDCQVVTDISPSGINFATTDSGVCVFLNEDAELEVFSVAWNARQRSVIQDSALGGDMRLMKLNGRIGFIRGSSLYRLELKR